MQLKKKDDKIDVLSKRIRWEIGESLFGTINFIPAQERRKFQADIQELKSQLSDKDLENVPPNDNTQMETVSFVANFVFLLKYEDGGRSDFLKISHFFQSFCSFVTDLGSGLFTSLRRSRTGGFFLIKIKGQAFVTQRAHNELAFA